MNGYEIDVGNKKNFIFKKMAWFQQSAKKTFKRSFVTNISTCFIPRLEEHCRLFITYLMIKLTMNQLLQCKAYHTKDENNQRKQHTFLILEEKKRKKLRNLDVFFICRWGATHRKNDDLSICPQNIISDFFRLLVIPIPGLM